MVVKDVQRVPIRRRHELEILSFPVPVLFDSTIYHFVLVTCQNIGVPNEDVVDISLAGPDRLCRPGQETVRIKLIQNEVQYLLSSLT